MVECFVFLRPLGLRLAKTYSENPTAFHLRAMNMLYEGLKTNSTIVVVPSSAIETMSLGGLTGTIALTKSIQQDKAKEAEKNVKGSGGLSDIVY